MEKWSEIHSFENKNKPINECCLCYDLWASWLIDAQQKEEEETKGTNKPLCPRMSPNMAVNLTDNITKDLLSS